MNGNPVKPTYDRTLSVVERNIAHVSHRLVPYAGLAFESTTGN